MDKLINRFVNYSNSVPIQIKIFVMILVVILAVSWINLVQVRQSLNETLSIQLDKQATSIGSDVTARSRDLFLTHNVYLLHELLQETVNNNPDIEYAFILDEKGRVMVHTFGDEIISEELLTINSVTDGEKYNLTKFKTSNGTIRDVAVPIVEGVGGTVRIGLTEQSLLQALSKITSNMFLTMFLVTLIAGLITFGLTKILTTPITQLLNMTNQVSQGNLSIRIKNYANDEIGKLTKAFNQMLDNLQKTEQEKEDYYQKVSLRNRELSLLNELSGTITTVNEMEKMIERFLNRLINELEFNACILNVKLLDKWKTFSYSSPNCSCIDAIPDESYLCHKNEKRRYEFLIKIKDEIIGKLEICSYQRLDEKSIDILGSLSNQLAVSIENMHLWHELKQKEEIRQKLLGKVISAQEEERKRIARELHDETSQSLTSILIGLSLLNDEKDKNEREKEVQKLRKLVQQTLEEVHETAWQLRPSILDKFGLKTALERYIEDYRNKHDIDIDLYISEMDIRLSNEIETTIYRITQEALTNVVRYAKAQNVSVIIERIDRTLTLIIEDDGIGFDYDKVKNRDPSKHNFGLIGMQERASLIGGKFTIESKIGKGTTLFVKIPISYEGVKYNEQN